ncbi:sensor histidine kinase [Amycolatopsis sp. 195334CR]|uniref:sensor histidine kinase n=1 Tax=Amycolatopsis sp. 195334CR TaxID=2814588 RepID=UPI001A900663|nr:histidine kinase [Amycolatopsis sp. 195334CR]MBN6039230.1 sensor histidine kinase [Amycolatopsis sp. 195334CR]
MQRLNLWFRAHPWVLDLPVYALLVSYPPGRAPGWPVALLWLPIAALIGALALRRRHPRAAAVAVLVIALVQYTNDGFADDRLRTDVAVAVALYTLAVHGDRRFGAAVFAVNAVLRVAWETTWGGDSANGPTLEILTALTMQVAAWALGEYVRSRRRLDAEVALRAVQAENERHALARAAVAEERANIARELHDVLAHSVSVIVLNAEGAKLMRHQDPGAVDRTLDTISQTGRGALAELRRLLEVLHAGEAARAPQPTTAELRDLVAQLTTDRRRIEIEVTGDDGGLPASAALQAYRIVQEALTNMIKHAPADADGRVTVHFGGHEPRREIRIEVTNSGGTAPPAPALPSSGRGLAGMAQRVEMYHGRLHTGSTEDGGYRVAATLVVGP